MRIVMTGPFGFRPKKTMRSRAFRLARGLVARGHTVRLIMPPWHTPEEGGRTWEEDGVQLQYVRVDDNPVAITARLIRETARWRPDVIHCFKPIAYSQLVAVYFNRLSAVRVVLDMDDWEGWGGWNGLSERPYVAKWVIAQQEQWGMRECAGLTVASRQLERLAIEAGVAAGKISYLPNGSGIEAGVVDRRGAEGRGERKQSKRLLVYSRFFEFDVARLVAVIGRVYASVPDLRVLVIGASLHEGDGRRFNRLLTEAGLNDIIDNVGWVEEVALPGLMRSAAVGIYLMDDTLLNRAKCPVKLADMIMVGLPVVGEAVGQVTEYVDHGRTGLLRPSGDVNGVADDVIRLLEDGDLAREMGERAAERYRLFEWERAAEVVEGVYQ